MGSDAEIYVFDDIKYQTECLPEILRMISGESVSGWFASTFIKIDSESFNDFKSYANEYPINIIDNCKILSPDLEYIGYYYRDKVFDEGFHYHNFEKLYSNRYCKITKCKVTEHCPFHQNSNNKKSLYPMADFTSLLQEIIGNFCLTSRQFLGRSMTPFKYGSFVCKSLSSNDIKEKIIEYLYLLGSRGYIIGYGFGNSDGIHGWLKIDETIKFVNLLKLFKKADLPYYSPTIENVALIRYAVDYIIFLENPTFYANTNKDFSKRPGDFEMKIAENYDWNTISLSFLRVIAEIAVSEKKGILWANDLCYSQKWK